MIKQVLVLRTDLNMRKGKMVAQGSHASMKVFFDLIQERPFPMPRLGESVSILPTTITIPLHHGMSKWVFGTFTKIVVGVDSEAAFLTLEQAAKDAGLPCAAIQDLGHTEFHGVPTWTALAIGPAEAADIDKITGHLKLL